MEGFIGEVFGVLPRGQPFGIAVLVDDPFPGDFALLTARARISLIWLVAVFDMFGINPRVKSW
jgi:hypothetical protein